jgi:hypothetical protein
MGKDMAGGADFLAILAGGLLANIDHQLHFWVNGATHFDNTGFFEQYGIHFAEFLFP